MLRIVHLAILPGVLLTTCTAWVFADTTRPANRVAIESKQMYSNRPAGFTVPVPYYGTPMAPRFMAPPTMVQSRPAVTVSRVHQTSAPAIVVAPVQVPPAPLAVASNTSSVSQFAVPQVIEKTIVLREPQPEANVNDELDTFYARMAKIRLEQRQLPEALALIQKIKSETFRVRTVVSLAEYVSRDKSYQSEADQLYRLALAGMEALDRGQPFRIDAGGENAPLPVNPLPSVPAPVPQDPPVVVAPPRPAPELLNPPIVTPPTPDTKPQPTPVVDPAEPPPVALPPELSLGGPLSRPPLVIEGDTGRNGRSPPPQGNGVDSGIAISPPEKPPITPEQAPPARTTEENNGLTPPPPIRPAPIPFDDEVPPPDPSATVPTPEPLPFVRPTPAIPLVDTEPEPPIIVPRQEREEVPPPQRPPARRPPRIILDEN